MWQKYYKDVIYRVRERLVATKLLARNVTIITKIFFTTKLSRRDGEGGFKCVILIGMTSDAAVNSRGLIYGWRVCVYFE